MTGLVANPTAMRAVSIVLGIILLALTARGLKSGSAQLVYRFVHRNDDAPLYWATVAVSAAVGAFLVLGAIFPKLEGF